MVFQKGFCGNTAKTAVTVSFLSVPPTCGWRFGYKRPTRNCHENPFPDRAAVLCPVFWTNSSIHPALFTVIMKFQSAAYATFVCFHVLWKCCCVLLLLLLLLFTGVVSQTQKPPACCPFSQLPCKLLFTINSLQPTCPCRVLCSLAMFWLQFRQKTSFITLR